MNVAKLKIADLKKELKERGLPTSGNKSELAARLREALAAEGGADGSQHEDDLQAKESELLGEEEDEEEEDTASPEDLDTKLLDASTTAVAGTPVTPAVKPKRIIINREAAETAQKAAASAIAEAAKAVPPEPVAPAPATVTITGDTPPAPKRIKITGLTESERLARRAEKLGVVPASDKTLSNVKILTAEERKAARLAKFGSPTTPVTGTPLNNSTDDLEKLKKRADRFGEAVSAKVMTLEESERMKKRKERFGIVTPEDAKARRAARFSSGTPIDPATEDKKKLRAARFGLA